MIKVGICTNSQDDILGGMSPYLAIIMSLLIIVGRQSPWSEMVSAVLVGANSENIFRDQMVPKLCTIPTLGLRAHSGDHRPQPITRISRRHRSCRPSFPLFFAHLCSQNTKFGHLDLDN